MTNKQTGGQFDRRPDESDTSAKESTGLVASTTPPKAPPPASSTVTAELKVTAEGRMSWGV